jgi:hypothetical protein
MVTVQGARTDLTSSCDPTKFDALTVDRRKCQMIGHFPKWVFRAGVSPVQATTWERLAAIPDAPARAKRWAPASIRCITRGPLCCEILAKMRHERCGGRAGKAELLTGIEGVSSRLVRGLDPGITDAVRDHVAAEPVKHMDETGFRMCGERCTVGILYACPIPLRYHV